LVAIGVAGEFAVHLKAGKVETDIKTITRELTSSAESNAANANLEAAKLRRAIAGRELTAEQQRAIAAKLAQYSGRTVWLRSYKGDPEAKRLGKEIISALRLATYLSRIGWKRWGFGLRWSSG
jgi:hypothetical protein